MHRRIALFCILLFLIPLSLVSECGAIWRGDEIVTLEIGATAPDFELPGVDGRTYRLGDFADSELLVILFTCNHCPTAQAYEDRIIKLDSDYRDRGVALVAISPNDPLAVRLDELGYSDLGDSLEDMKIRAEHRGFEFPYLYDGETQEASRAYGVRATPHAYVFDRERKLRYVGRIDDSEVKTVTSHDLRNALDSLLDGKAVPLSSTRVFGCSTKWADKRDNARQSIERWNKEPVELNTVGSAQLETLVQNDSDKYRLINVWATWCASCVAEMPELIEINRMYRNRPFEMYTISADEPDQSEQVLALLRQKHVAAKNLLFGSDDRDALFDALDPEWEGGVPFTILVAPGGEVVYREHGMIDPLELKRAIVERVGRTYASREPRDVSIPEVQEQQKNLLKPANVLDSWTFELTGDGKGSMEIDGDAIVFHTTKLSTENWHVQAYQTEVDLEDGAQYELKFSAKSPNSSTMLAMGIINQEDWHGIGLNEPVQLGRGFREYVFTFTATDVVEKNNRIGFVLGENEGSVHLKNMSLTRKPMDQEQP